MTERIHTRFGFISIIRRRKELKGLVVHLSVRPKLEIFSIKKLIHINSPYRLRAIGKMIKDSHSFFHEVLFNGGTPRSSAGYENLIDINIAGLRGRINGLKLSRIIQAGISERGYWPH